MTRNQMEDIRTAALAAIAIEDVQNFPEDYCRALDDLAERLAFAQRRIAALEGATK